MVSSRKITLNILNNDLATIRGIGPAYLMRLNKLGLKTVDDLLRYFPFRYQDFSESKKIADLVLGETASVVATVEKIKTNHIWARKLSITEATVTDETGSIKAVWYNQSYLEKNLPIGSLVSLAGKVAPNKKVKNRLFLSNPAYEIISLTGENHNFNSKHTQGLIPVYSETRGLTSRALRYFIKPIIDEYANKLPDGLPEEILKTYKLYPIGKALKEIHFPTNLDGAERARKRFTFEEVFLTQIHLLQLRAKFQTLKAPKIKADVEVVKQFLETLPFKLTHSQREALWQIMQDMETGRPMNRLLEGDVGSGKTLVALVASLLAVRQGWQVTIMAPTAILAKQHFQTFTKFLGGYPHKVCLLTSNDSILSDDGLTGSVSKPLLIKRICAGEPMIIIGTHALIQKKVKPSKLGLVVIDEQHRFGTEQRKTLGANLIKTSSQKIWPHLLSMTATPIPRTLSLAIYGNIDISILKEMPADRKPIATKVILPYQQKDVLDFVENEAQKGHQTFIICPRIEPPVIEGDINLPQNARKNLLAYGQWLDQDVKSVKKEFETYSKEIWPDLRVGMLHGKMKAQEKDATMLKMMNGDLDVLVATSVIEIGIDVPNATIMIIEGAELFGLAQLHQFRGRVGRRDMQSYCYLFAKDSAKTVSARLKIMEKNNDGFSLAEKDLLLRGPGDFIGHKQSGIPDLIMNALKNTELIEAAQKEAKKILNADASLKSYPNLLARYEGFKNKIHLE
ncbi:MAG: ATP-dependent DNA helicase RecG [Candidatus Parcubacteria bacterium]|nr:ATP-dependent DNA helicase RecG [Candidatus Parcubacteria bacterium]